MTKARSNATAPNAKGTLVVGTGTDASTTLAVASTAGYLLTVDSAEATGLKWAAPAASNFAGVVCRRGSAVSLSNDTSNFINWDVEILDSDDYHSTVTNASRLTVPAGKAGKYLIFATGVFNANNTGGRDVNVRLNGSTYIGGSTIGNAGASLNAAALVLRVYDLAVNDYVELDCYQNSGGSLNLVSGLGSSIFGMYLIGA